MAALDSDKPLPGRLRQAMWTPVRLNDGSTHRYGLGWFITDRNGRAVVEHGGAWQGFTSYVTKYLDDDLAVILLANLSDIQLHDIADGVAGLYDPDLRPVDRQPIALGPQVLQSYVGRYEVSPEFSMVVRKEGDQLVVRDSNYKILGKLMAESDTRFFTHNGDAQVKFQKNGRGEITGLVVTQGGDTAARRIR